jgi:hypothetical protein
MMRTSSAVGVELWLGDRLLEDIPAALRVSDADLVRRDVRQRALGDRNEGLVGVCAIGKDGRLGPQPGMEEFNRGSKVEAQIKTYRGTSWNASAEVRGEEAEDWNHVRSLSRSTKVSVRLSR